MSPFLYIGQSLCIFHFNGSNDVSKYLVSKLVMGSTKVKEQYLKIVGHHMQVTWMDIMMIIFKNLSIIYLDVAKLV